MPIAIVHCHCRVKLMYKIKVVNDLYFELAEKVLEFS